MSDFENKFFAWLLNDGPMPPILEDLPKIPMPVTDNICVFCSKEGEGWFCERCGEQADNAWKERE